jgi:tetratricopeptide (TPR) repeat protein
LSSSAGSKSAASRSASSTLLLGLCLLSTPALAEVRQDGVDKDDPESKAEAPDRPVDMPLAELPNPPDFRLAAPRPQAIEAIDRVLNELVAPEQSVREDARGTLLEAKDDWVSGLALRIDRIAERADKEAMKRTLEKARDRARDQLRAEMGKTEATPDYLEVVQKYPEPGSQPWRDVTQLLGISRMLSAIGTTEANREIIRIFVRFGEFMRIDCQRQLESMGDLSVAALIETQRHPAPAIAEWAEKLLRQKKKHNPHDAVRTEHPAALADVLVALGRNGDPETARLLISFAGTDQAQVRKAARQGIALLGEVASWQLRDAYLNTTGKQPPRDWTWKRTARELFTEFDRLRLERIYKIYGEAKAAFEKGDLKKMAEGYDQVLAQNPEFDGRAEMVPGYRKYAQTVASEDPSAALLALRRAARIDPEETSRKQTEAELLLLQAKRLKEKGFIDSELLRRAEASSQTVRDEVLSIRTPGQGVAVWGKSSRYFVAFAVSLVALFGAGWVMLSSLRGRPKEHRAAPSQSDD